jgi:hypothetical protein
MAHFYLSYERIAEHIAKVPHYRGTQNRYPFGRRTDLNRYILVNEEDGKQVFDICYSYKHVSVEIPVEEYKKTGTESEYSRDGRYFKYAKNYNPLLRVRADETIEFIGKDYHQGERMFIGECTPGLLYNDSRRGGVVMQSGKDYMMPIYTGLRLNISDAMPRYDDVKVVLKTVNRKKSKELVQSYETFFKVSETMVSSLADDAEMWLETCRDVANEFSDPAHEGIYSHHNFSKSEYKTKFISMLNERPLDALIVAILHYDIGGIRWALRNKNPYMHGRLNNPMACYEATKRRILTDLYKDNSDLFKDTVYPAGKPYPATTWGVTVLVNGTATEQCGFAS